MKHLAIATLIAVSAGRAFAPLVTIPPPVPVLAQQADLIFVAKLVSIDDSTGAIQLHLSRILHGEPGTLSLIATVPPRPGPNFVGETPAQIGYVPHSLLGTTGIWFLKSGKLLFPSIFGVPISYMIPVRTDLAEPKGTLNQQLLIYLADWYSTLREPTFGDDELLIKSFKSVPDDAAPAVDSLIASPNPITHATGLAIALHLGSVDALNKVAGELPSFSTNPKWNLIKDGISQGNFKPGDLSTLPPLERIIRARSGLPEVDGVSSILLRKIGGKATLPLIALLLDSREPLAQQAAAWVFAQFTMWADKDGVMHQQEGRYGPFDSPINRSQMPGMSRTETTAEYAQYWKNWWRENYVKLGFSNP